MATDPLELLQHAVAALSRFFVGDESLGATLHRVSELTIKALPQTTHVGITMMVNGKPGTAIFTHPDTPEIDQAQYRTGDGPCLDAFRTGETQVIDSTLEAGPWREFRESAALHGVLSTMSLPMIAHEPIGALNLYAGRERAYDERSMTIGSTFASQAAFVLANAQAYWDARDLGENLEQAMMSRSTIEQAKGIIIAASRCNPDEAMRLLIDQSQGQNIKLREVAAEIVANAMRRSN